MSFAKDRDLLVYEPLLFRDVAWSGQRLHESGGVTVAGTSLLVVGADFVSAGIDAGHVAVVDGLALEIVSRQTTTQLEVSLLRAKRDGANLPPPAVTNGTMTVCSFGPQLEMAHEQLLRCAGIELSDAGATPGEMDITNSADLIGVEALGALHLIFAAASAMAGPNSLLWTKAKMYRKRFAAHRDRAMVEVDLNGDGSPDAIRRFNTLQFVRG